MSRENDPPCCEDCPGSSAGSQYDGYEYGPALTRHDAGLALPESVLRRYCPCVSLRPLICDAVREFVGQPLMHLID